jgi:FkbM family methyltransferase
MCGEPPPIGAKGSTDIFRLCGQFNNLPVAERISLLTGVAGASDLRLPTELRESRRRTLSLDLNYGNNKLTIAAPDDSGIRYVIDEIFHNHCYRPIPKLSPPPRTILDIGANIGLSAAYFRLVYPDAAIYCIEPDPSAYNFLTRNSQIIGNCHAYLAGLSDATYATKFQLGSTSVLNSATRERKPGVRTLLLDAKQFLEQLPIKDFDIIKIDTEGSEVPIIMSLREQIEKTRVVHLEFHSHSDRRIIDELLNLTHYLWYGKIESPHRGVFTYVVRSVSSALLND